MVDIHKSLSERKKPQSKASLKDKGVKVPSFLRNRIWLAALLVAVLTFVVYLPALENDFVNWDDQKFIYENTHITSLNIDFLKWSLTNQKSQWSPLRWLSHAVDYKIWKLNPVGHHLSNVLLHVLNTFLVVVFVMWIFRTVESQRLPFALQEEAAVFWKRAFITSIITGLFFGLHPLRVESVAWVSARKDVLYSFFFLISLIFYLGYVSSSRGRGIKYFFLCLISFIMALMSKAMAVTLPFVLILLDVYPLKRFNSGSRIRVLVEKVPFFGLSLASALITVMVHQEMGAVTPLVASTLSERILVAFKSLSFYLLKTVWPSNLVPYHQYPYRISFLSLEYIGSIILVVAVTVLCVYSWNKGKRIWLAVWLYFVLHLLPVPGIFRIGGYFAAERYTYIPSIGPFLLIGLGVSLVWERANARERGFFPGKGLVILVLVMILSVLSVLTVKQIKIWKDSLTLWTHELEIHPDAMLAYALRGGAYADSGDNQQAVKNYTMAMELNPGFSKAYNNRGKAYYALGNYQQAVKDLTKAIELNPEAVKGYHNRGKAYYALGNYQQAVKDLTKAIELNPRAVTYYYRGKIYADMGKEQRALNDLNKAIEYSPGNALAYKTRGDIYLRLGDLQGALVTLNKAIDLKPDFTEALSNRCGVYIQMGNYLKAIKDCSRVLEINPQNAMAYNNRGLAFNASGDFEKAIMDYSQAIALNPGDPGFYRNRGTVYIRIGKDNEAIRDLQKAAGLDDKKIQKFLKKRGISW